jgi:hypothetical protein
MQHSASEHGEWRVPSTLRSVVARAAVAVISATADDS